MEVASELKLVEQPEKPMAMHPQKFALWLFMISIVMLFAALTSAYIVRKGDGNWRMFNLPDMFYYSTAIIIFSSASLHWAYLAAKKDNFFQLKLTLVVTFILGLIFLVAQVFATADLVANNVYFTGGNPSESFLYVLAGIHTLHLVSGLIFLAIVIYGAFKLNIHKKNMVRLSMCTTYWHFLGGLWIYLFVFLLLNHNY